MFTVTCDGQMLNPCTDMSEQQVHAVFNMYARHRYASGSKTFRLLHNGKVIDEHTTPKVK